MKVLFLDDMESRANTFRTKFPDLVWCDNSASAIEKLRDNDYDLVCLDYDLDLTNPGDFGMNVVSRLIDLKNRRNDSEWAWQAWCHVVGMKYVVHSTNLIMGLRMTDVLCDMGYNAHYVPFTSETNGPYNK